MPLLYGDRIKQVNEVKTLLDQPVVNFNEDQGRLFFGLCEFEITNSFPEAFKREVKLFELYKPATRLANRLNLEVSFGTLAFLVMSGNCFTVRDLTLYFLALKRYANENELSVITLEIFATAFKGGLPAPDSLDQAWEDQKLSDGTNAVDYLVANEFDYHSYTILRL